MNFKERPRSSLAKMQKIFKFKGKIRMNFKERPQSSAKLKNKLLLFRRTWYNNTGLKFYKI